MVSRAATSIGVGRFHRDPLGCSSASLHALPVFRKMAVRGSKAAGLPTWSIQRTQDQIFFAAELQAILP